MKKQQNSIASMYLATSISRFEGVKQLADKALQQLTLIRIGIIHPLPIPTA